MDDASDARLGRYVLGEQIGAGGMARVHLGRLASDAMVRAVAIKRLAPGLIDPRYRVMLGDEARVVARIRHPNVVQMLEVVTVGDELLLVMEYIDGASLGRLIRAAVRSGQRVPVAIAAAVICQVLEGLHAAHEAIGGDGLPLHIVHRDVSPDNVLVGADGFARVLDFGVAKARSREEQTRDGAIKGKLAYMAPEQMSGRATRQSDVFSASVVAWECLAGRRLFQGDDVGELVGKVMAMVIEPPAVGDGVTPGLSEIVMRGLAREPKQRWATARDMAEAIAAEVTPATPTAIAAWVEAMAGEELATQRERVRRVETMQLDADEVAVPAVPVGAPLMSGTRTTVIMRDTGAGDVPALARVEVVPGPAMASDVPSVRPRARVGIAAAAVAGLAVAVGWLAWPGAAAPREPVVQRGAAPSEPVPRAAASEPVPSAAVPVPSAAVAVPVSSAAPVPSAPVPPASVTSAQSKPASRPARGSTAHGAGHARPAASCDPPYRLGSLGEKIWRKECL